MVFKLRPVALALIFFCLTLKGWGQTAYTMSSGNKTWDLSGTWTVSGNTYTGTDAGNWGSVGIIGSGTSVTTGTRTTKSSAVIVTTTTGGFQKPSGTIQFLSTGSTTTPEAVAIDLLLDFTGRTAGTLSFDWAAIDNSSGTRPTSLRVFWSTDGTTFTEITGAQLLDKESATSPASGSITAVALPSNFNNSATARLRFYNHAGSNAIGSGTRDKMQIDNIAVTSTATTPSVNLSSNVSTGTEAASTSITLTATASAAVSGNQTVDVALSGTGLTAADFTGINFGVTQTITILSGATTGTKTFTVTDDAAYECSETATFTISNPSSGVVLGATTSQNLAITDNDLPVVDLSTNTTTGSEAAATSVTLTATSAAAVIGAQTVTVGLSGTGLTNSDFSGVTFPATITIANGATTGSITFTVNDDVAYEGTENATFTISAPSPCVVLGSTLTQNLSITDNDLPSVNLSINTGTGTEAAATSITLTATSAIAVSGDQTVDLSLTGTGLANADFTGATFPTTITIANGTTTGTKTFSIVDDAAYECTETATFTISNPSSGIALGSTTTQNLAITDNDQPAVNLSINTSSGSEAATTSVTLTATSAANAIGAQTVTVSLSGTGLTNSDFSGVTFPATITIANGSSTGAITFTVANDVAIEGTETATFTIGSPSACVALGSTLTQNLTITDNDFPAVNLSISPASGTEAATTSVTLTATASQAVVGDQTVSVALTGTGLTNGDFTGATFPATITILNGQTTGNLTFAIADDNAAEGAETATFTISSPSSGIVLGATTVKTLAITDNPLTYIVLNSLNVPATENFAGMGTSGTAATPTGFGIEDLSNTTVTSAVTQQASSGTPTSGGAYNWGQNGTSDRGLGLMFSGGYSGRGIVAAVKNNTGTAGTVFQIIFNYEQYRRNSAAQTFKLQYSTALGGPWTDISGGAFTNMVTGADAYNFTTLMASQSINIQYSPASSVANGGVVYFRWLLDLSSNSNGVGIDDVSIALITTSCSAPTNQAHDIAFANVTQNTLDLNWATGNGDNKVVYMNNTNSFTAPVDGAALPGTNTVWQNAGQQLILNGNTNSTSVSGLVAGNTYWFRVYEYNCTSLNTKFNSSTATLNPNSQQTNPPASTASFIQAVAGSEANTISSLSNGTISNNTQGTQVWQFKLFDGDGTNNDGDVMPTVYTQWTIRAATGNTVPNWSTVIDNVKFFKGSSSTPISGSFIVSNSTISFTPTTGVSVADGAGSFEQISMRLTLDNPMAAGSDGKFLVFKLDNADVSVGVNTSSSQLGTFSPASNTGKNQIDVTATLQFINAPAAVVLGSNFTATVSAVDANGNIDQNQTTAITLAQFSGTGTLTGGTTQNLVNGTTTFTGLSYNQVGSFQIQASGGSFSPVNATINCTNDPFQSFDDFNRADNNTVGTPSSGGATAWTETGGPTARQRIQSNQLVLSNGDAACASSGTGYEQVVFDGASKYSTVFNNAGGALNWLFNMRSSRSTPSGFSSSSNTYGLAMVLGCSQSDFTSATANGYAVIIGNVNSPDPLKLIYFTGGLSDNANITNIATSTYTGETDYLSVKVTFNPCNGGWSLYVRNDGASAFASPITGSLGSAFTGNNTTYTASDLKYFGMAWQHNSSCEEKATFDDLYIPNAMAGIAGTKTWNGSAGSDWNTAANWGPCPGVPTSADNVIIPVTGTNPVLSATPAGICKDLTVNASAGLTINSGQFLNVRGNVVNNGNAAFGAGTLSIEGAGSATVTGTISVDNVDISKAVTVNSGASLSVANSLDLQSGSLTNSGTVTLKSGPGGTAYLNNFGSNTGTYVGNLTVERYISNPAKGYRDISSPVATTVNDLTDDFSVFGQDAVKCWYAYSPYPNVQIYDEALSIVNGAYYEGWLSYTGTSNALTPMKGIAARTYVGGPVGQPYTIDLTGAPYNGAKSINITNTVSGTTSQDGWNFVGNPYPSPIDWVAVAAMNPSITGSYYIFQTTNEYAGGWGTCNAAGACTGTMPLTRYITSSQGFFVKANSNSSFVMNNTVRTTTGANFYKTEALTNEIRVDLTNGTDHDEILAYSDINATTGNDQGYDAEKIAAGSTVYMSYAMPGVEYAINVLDAITEQTELPLNIWVTDNGTYTFSAVELNLTGLTAWLKDAQTNTLYELAAGPVSLTLAGGQNYSGRYSIVFKAEVASVITNTNQPDIRIYSSGNKLFVERSSLSPATITITNVLGQQIKEVVSHQEKTEISLPSAELWYAFVKVTEGSKVNTAKVLISNK